MPSSRSRATLKPLPGMPSSAMVLALVLLLLLFVVVRGYFFNRSGPGDNVGNPNVVKRRNVP